MEKIQGKLTRIAGDASFRQFYRLKKGKRKSIIVLAEKEKYKNLIVYSAINKFLYKNKILTPKLKKFSFKRGIIEIDDFGKVLFSKLISKENKYKSYIKLVKVLIKIQKIKPKKTINSFKPYKIKLNFYNKYNLHKESDLFLDWYLVGILGKKKAKKYRKSIRKELDKIYNKIHLKNNYFVHRDFHASNFMLFNGKVGVLDSQDAIIGNPTYDLASLIDDVRIKTSPKLKEKIFSYYLKNTAKKLRKHNEELRNDFNILSLQRNLKILGIFYRLFKRDKKNYYLKFIPYTWKLIEMRTKNSMFKKLRILLHKAVNKKERKKIIFK